MSETRRVLVIVAHPDDETLGMGGTLRRHADLGDEVCALHLTNGVGARGCGGEQERAASADGAAAALGFRWAGRGDFPDNRLDSLPLLEVVQFIERVKQDVAPELVYTHHGGDLNVDHRVCFGATLTAFRPQPGEPCVELRTFEVASATDWGHAALGKSFEPTLFVDVGATWSAKLAALKAYAAELRLAPHARSLEGLNALARLRGAQVGLEQAEAFELVRRVVR